MADRPRNVNRPSGVCSRTRLVRDQCSPAIAAQHCGLDGFADKPGVQPHRPLPVRPPNELGVPVVPVGVDRFGQSGSRQALYESTGIDAGQIGNAALLALELAEG